MKTILVVDDEPKICELLSDILRQHNYQVVRALTTEEAYERLSRAHPDLILLDMEIPLKGGLEFCREIKANELYRYIPIVFLTVRSHEMDKVTALNLGGDDFITKPFSQKELLARIHAVFRRQSLLVPSTQKARSGSLVVDFRKRMVQIHDRELSLTAKEFELLKLLYSNRHRVLSTKEIFARVWGADSNSFLSTVYTHIGRLRKKLKEHGRKIKVLPGTGFRFDERSLINR